MSWRDQAACAGKPTHWWDLIGEVDDPAKLTADNRRAIDICATCPVARACFGEALNLGDHGFIRGGIPLWKPSEVFRCVACRKAGLRPVVGSRYRPRQYCGDECRANVRRVAGVQARQRQLEAVA